MRTRSLAVVAALPLAFVSLTACGSSSKSSSADLAAAYAKTDPATIEKDAKAALKALKSVHVTATVTDASAGSKPTSMDLSMDTDKNCTGTVTTDGTTLGVIVAGSNTFIKADSAFWTAQGAPSSEVEKVADKWVSGLPASEVASACDLSAFVNDISSGDSGADTAKVIGPDTVNGIAVVNVEVTDKDGVSTISVEAAAPHNVIQAVSKDGKNKISFTDINKPVNAVAPADAVDIKSLG